MADTPFIDRVDTLNFTEKLGVIRTMTRKVRVILDPSTRPTDFTALSQALKVCPAVWSTLANEGYAALVLVERSPSVAEGEPSCIDVILKYEHILDGPNQILSGNLTNQAVFGNNKPALYSKGRSSVVEKTTNFYYPYGDTSQPRILIQVGHEFTKGDQGLPSLIINNQTNPYSSFQGGEVSIPFPQENFSVSGVVATFDPHSIARMFVGKISDRMWIGKPANTWLCTEAKWEVIDPVGRPGPGGGKIPIYKFDMEFQYNIDTWNPTVVFNDQRTGRPPHDVVEGYLPDPNVAGPNLVFSYVFNSQNLAVQPAGYWEVPALPEADFFSLFLKVLA